MHTTTYDVISSATKVMFCLILFTVVGLSVSRIIEKHWSRNYRLDFILEYHQSVVKNCLSIDALEHKIIHAGAVEWGTGHHCASESV